MMISPVKSDNITLNHGRNEASWFPERSGGCHFINPCLSSGSSVSIRISGSGNILLGITSIFPPELAPVPLSAADIRGFVLLNDVKLHKRACTIAVKINSKKTQVSSCFGEVKYSLNIRTDQRYWLVLDAKYGDIDVNILNPGGQSVKHTFIRYHGNNIQVLNDPTCAKTLQKSPASVCFTAQPLQPGTRLVLHGSPVTHNGLVPLPGRFCVSLHLIFKDPANFQMENPGLLDMSVPGNTVPTWTPLCTLEKEACVGEVSVELVQDVVVTTSALRNSQSLTLKNWRRQKEVWLAIELYGVDVKISEKGSDNNSVEVFPNAMNQIQDYGYDVSTIRCDFLSQCSLSTDSELGLESSNDNLSTISTPTRQKVPQQQFSLTNTSVVASEDISENFIRRNNIRRNFSKILEDLQPIALCDQLYQRGVISSENYHTLRNKAAINQRDANRDLLMCHLCKECLSQSALTEALQDSHQEFLVKYFVS